MTARRLVVVSAGVREPSSTRLLGDRLAEAATTALRARGVEVEPTVIELREHAHDLVNALATGFPTPGLQAALDAVGSADGVIAVTPVFSGSYSGVFKMFFDLLDAGAVTEVPVLLGATGGTVRHSLVIDHAMRPLFAYLGAQTVPSGVFAATDDFGQNGKPGGGDEVPLQRRVERAAGQLGELMLAKPARDRAADPLALPAGFEDLLDSST